jgi:hypothetical protein
MPKWLPKVMKNDPKWSAGVPRIDLFFDFTIFGEGEKT